PRYILPAAAATIVGQLPPLVMAVGVFADETEPGHVATVAHDARVNAVQLHGPRFPMISGALQDYPVIHAVTVRERKDLKELIGLGASAFLLDNFDPKLIGGTGKTIDWTLAREAKRYGSVILAGGLTPA